MKKRTVLAFMLSIMMVTSVVMSGCSKSEKDSSTTTGVESTSVTVADSTQGDSTATSEPDVLDVFINMSWYSADTFTGIIPDEIKKATNVELNYTIATDTEQLGYMIASGDIPDLVITDGNLDRLSNEKLCYSYSELEEKFGASFKDVSEEEKSIGKSFSADGSYYAILNNYNTKDEWDNMQIGAPGQAAVYYRQDLLDAMGNPKLETVDDFIAVLEKCKTSYPDMVPLGLGGYWKFQSLFSWTGANSSQYDGTNYFFSASAPKYKEYLQLANKLAREGIVTTEAYANENEAESHQTAYNGECVFYPFFLNYGNYVTLQTESQKVNPEANWVLMPSVGESAVGESRGWSGVFVSKSCKNVEAASRLLTYLYSAEGENTSVYGREGVDYTLDNKGVPQFSEEYFTSRSDGSQTTKYQPFFFTASAITQIYSSFAGLDEAFLAQVNTYGKGYKNYPEIGMATPLAASDEGVIKAKLDEIKKNYDGKVIFATTDEEFESYYNEYMNALKESGVDQYNEYMSNRIQEIKKQF